MWGLIKDLPEMVRELWWLWVPGVIVGTLFGYFLALWPVVIILALSALIVIVIGVLSTTASGPDAGLIVLFYFGVLCLGVFIGLGLTAMFVDTIHVSWIPLPSIEIDWSWLFRQ